MVRIRIIASSVVLGLVTGPGFAAGCDLGRAPTVPVIRNLPYKQVRPAILASGWTIVAGRPHNELSDNETNFRADGYAELQFCRLTADSLCRFEFTSPAGVVLWITTTGDENAALDSRATVKTAKLACAGDADPD
jgi:hypothetical protein